MNILLKVNGWTRAGVTGSSELFNICVAREPRFYAWLGFHQGDYSSRLQPMDNRFK